MPNWGIESQNMSDHEKNQDRIHIKTGIIHSINLNQETQQKKGRRKSQFLCLILSL